MKLARPLALTFALLAAAPIAPASSVDELNPEWGAILPASKAASLCYCGASMAGTWSPRESDIAALEKLLPVAMRAAFDRQEHNGAAKNRVGNYYRQYAGIYEGGKRLVVVNGFHKIEVIERTKTEVPLGSKCWTLGSNPENDVEVPCQLTSAPADFWKHEAVAVSDGGCHYFHGAFNADTKKFEYLFCQGTA